MQRVTGVVQRYPWGDTRFLPELLGIAPDGRPWAELWLGTHPNGPSQLEGGRPLADVTGELPYLLKILSASAPLSLQTHPDRERARAGHAAGRYPDPNPKPELLCALTPFEALCGIRPIPDTIELLEQLHLPSIAHELRAHGPVHLVAGLLRGEIDPTPMIDACHHADRPEARVVTRLDGDHPGDPSVAASLLLNLVELRPGEAISLPAGNLHAYLHGSGIELMGASDNVVRAGLTTKPVDVDEVLAIIDPTPLADPVIGRTDRYHLPDEVATLVRVAPGDTHTASGHELAVDLAGAAWYLAPGDRFEPTVTTFVACAGSA